MLIASIIIYVFNYVRNKLTKIEKCINILALLAVLAVCFVSPVAAACIFGMVIGWNENRIEKIINSRVFAVTVIISCFVLYFIPKTELSFLFFAALVIFIPKTKVINSVFSSRVFGFYGNISFGIYSFHWPLYCSVGALIIILLSQYISVGLAVLIAAISSVLLTVILSIGYHYSFERVSSNITKKVLFIMMKQLK